MKVRLELHLEVDDEREFVWWASSPDVPGLYAAADLMVECVGNATIAASEILGEAVDIVPVFAEPDQRDLGPNDLDETKQSSPPSVTRYAVAA
jgi:predicted RNase H-like HicB family nuclease